MSEVYFAYLTHLEKSFGAAPNLKSLILSKDRLVYSSVGYSPSFSRYLSQLKEFYLCISQAHSLLVGFNCLFQQLIDSGSLLDFLT